MMNNPYANFLNQTQPQPSPWQQPQQQPYTPPQQPVNGLIRVTGEEGAKAYQLPPNSYQVLFDEGGDVFYIKSTDGAGFPTLKAFNYHESEPQALQTPVGDYVTREEFNKLLTQLGELTEPHAASSEEIDNG